MTNSKIERRNVEPGDTIHAVRSGLKLDETTGPMSRSIELHRGREITLTAQLIDASKDKFGNSFLDLVFDPEEQLRRWGQVKIVFGAKPADFRDIEPGTVEAEIARANERAVAVTIPDPATRQKLLREIDDDYGRPTTSKTIGEYHGGRHSGFPEPFDA